MRVLLICATYPPTGKGGAPLSSELLARGLAQRGHSVRVVTVADGETVRRRHGIEIKTLSSLNIYCDDSKPVSLGLQIIWQTLENFNPRAFYCMRHEILRIPAGHRRHNQH